MEPTQTLSDLELDRPMSPRQLAEVEDLPGPRSVYEAIYAGKVDHFRLGRAIRITRRMWRAQFEGTLVRAGSHRRDPILSERALRRAAARAERSGVGE